MITFALVIEACLIGYLFYIYYKKKDESIKSHEIEVKREKNRLYTHYEELLATKEELEELKTRYEYAFMASDSGVWEENFDATTHYVQKEWYSKYFDFPGGTSILAFFRLAMLSSDYIYYRQFREKMFKGTKQKYSIEYRIYSSKIKKVVWIKENGILKRTDQGEVYRVIGSHKDITEEKVNNKRLHDLLYRDPLTELYNKKSIQEYIDKLVSDDISKYGTHALILLDLNNFKHINENFGHDQGDKILVKLSNRFKGLINNNIFVGRFGGDEFIFIYEDYEDNKHLEELIQSIDDAYSENIMIKSTSFSLNASMGIVKYPYHGKNASELLRKADLAMYQAKSIKDRSYYFFDESLNRQLEEKMEFKQAIDEALYEERFHLYYQPQINIETQKIEGIEALIRWNSPIYGNVSPARLIDEAEESGAIYEIGLWVFREAFMFYRELAREVDWEMKISVNLSTFQIRDIQLVKDFRKILDEVGINPENIVLEITETTLMENFPLALKTLQDLKRFGVSLALDDFGTGYSSLNYFRKIPVDIVKIDKSFIDSIPSNREDIKLIEAILMIAKNKNLDVIAEGVETEEQVEILSSMECNTFQGYYFSKPLSDQSLIHYIKNRTKF